MSRILSIQADCDDGSLYGCEFRGWSEGETSVRISNDAAENGYDQDPGPLCWLNSARITADPDEDAVHCVVSVGDPRGGFCFTVRRLSDGRLMIHTPYPGEGMAHMATRQDHPGCMLVVSHDNGEPLRFSDEDCGCVADESEG